MARWWCSLTLLLLGGTFASAMNASSTASFAALLFGLHVSALKNATDLVNMKTRPQQLVLQRYHYTTAGEHAATSDETTEHLTNITTITPSTEAAANAELKASMAHLLQRMSNLEVTLQQVLQAQTRMSSMTTASSVCPARCPMTSEVRETLSEMLFISARQRNAEQVRMLLCLGADIHYRDQHKSTALHQAAVRNSLDAVRALIDSGAEINAKDNWTRTPLHYAVADGHDTVSALLEVGADPGIRDYKQNTPHALATSDAVRSLLSSDSSEEDSSGDGQEDEEREE